MFNVMFYYILYILYSTLYFNGIQQKMHWLKYSTHFNRNNLILQPIQPSSMCFLWMHCHSESALFMVAAIKRALIGFELQQLYLPNSGRHGYQAAFPGGKCWLSLQNKEMIQEQTWLRRSRRWRHKWKAGKTLKELYGVGPVDNRPSSN